MPFSNLLSSSSSQGPFLNPSVTLLHQRFRQSLLLRPGSFLAIRCQSLSSLLSTVTSPKCHVNGTFPARLATCSIGCNLLCARASRRRIASSSSVHRLGARDIVRCREGNVDDRLAIQSTGDVQRYAMPATADGRNSSMCGFLGP